MSKVMRLQDKIAKIKMLGDIRNQEKDLQRVPKAPKSIRRMTNSTVLESPQRLREETIMVKL